MGADLSGSSLVCAGLERTDLTDASLRGAYVHALAVQASFLAGADLRQLVDATGSLFHGCSLAGARLTGSELAGSTFYQCDLGRADLSDADLHGAVFNECGMADVRLLRAHLDHASITRCNLSGGDLSEARGRGLVIQRPTSADRLVLKAAQLPSLRLLGVRAHHVSAAGLHAPSVDVEGGDLAGIDLSGADLRRARLVEVSLDGAVLDRALLQEATLCGVTGRRIQGEGIRAEGLTAAECTFTDAVMPRFAGRYATFRNCDLSRVDLRESYLYRASVIGDPPASARLVGARLDGTNLTQAYLAADLSEATFPQGWATYARINQSIFDGADLRGTSLYRASAVKTNFSGARLGGQRGALLTDRCVGLVEALRASKDPDVAELADEVEALASLLARDPGKST
ncbi:pentapeptide repeat-containing protein [Actinocorallia sp. API 0066]|uniref:pentapeptide repeat-containing protein n=1 Tax=Actinocorallia sp. API 0066 TaxID=2896846 RepID=UPI001E2B35D9|nr:pentapeptide repeat-containing protein [Actinocorallia sp. API 0066]MCD0453249.1 pentapeptide repeat-containing protein [Actinocorallia sp. API 0066]